MADNLSKAYEIYRFIQDMQIEQIKNKTIKPEDVIKISKDDFIKELQDTVNFYTKGTTNKRIIDDVYSNISTMIKKVSSIDEIISGKDIRIPDEVIAKSVDMAVQKEKIKNIQRSELVESTKAAILISQFESFKTNEEAEAFFNGLSKEEKRELRDGLIEEIYTGKFKSMVQEDNAKNDAMVDSEEYRKASSELKRKADKVANSNSRETMLWKELGLSKTNLSEFEKNRVRTIIKLIKENPLISNEILDKNRDFLNGILEPSMFEKFIYGATHLEEIEEIVVQKGNKSRDNKKNILIYNQSFFKGFLEKHFGDEFTSMLSESDIDSIFVDTFNLDGDFNYLEFIKKVREIAGEHQIELDEITVNDSGEFFIGNRDHYEVEKEFKSGIVIPKEYTNSYIGENTPAQDSPEIPQEPQKPNASERDSKPVQESVAQEVAEAASFFTFTANDMMSFAAFTPSIGMEQDKTDFMNAFASFAQIPDASVTPVYEASTDEIQVDPAIHGMVDEERPTPPVTEENETDVRGSGADGTTPPDIVTEETELDGDEDRDSPKDQETEENEKTQNTYGKDSFPGLIKAAEITINDMRATQNELNPKDQNRINETNELDDDKDTK